MATMARTRVPTLVTGTGRRDNKVDVEGAAYGHVPVFGAYFRSWAVYASASKDGKPDLLLKLRNI